MVCDLDHCTFSFTSAVTSAEIRTHRGGCGESHLGSGRSLGWLRSQRLMKKGCSGLRGQATARVLRPHTHQTLGIEREGGKKGGSRLSERAQCPWSAPYPVLSCPGGFTRVALEEKRGPAQGQRPHGEASVDVMVDFCTPSASCW